MDPLAAGPDAPALHRSVAAAIQRRAREAPERRALVFSPLAADAHEITRGQLDADARATAALFHASGIRGGDAVLLALDHGYEAVRALVGALYLGALPIVAKGHRRSAPTERIGYLRDLVRRVSAAGLVIPPDAPPDWDEILTIAGLRVIRCGASTGSEELPPNRRGGEDIAYLQLTTGTTGPAKPAAVSHRAVLANVDALVDRWSLTDEDVVVHWLPLHHDMGLVVGLLLPLTKGFTSVLLSPDRWVREPALLLRAVEAYRGTCILMPNFGFDYCRRRVRASHLDGLDLSSLRIVSSGAEPISADTLLGFAEWLAPHGLSQETLCPGYGMAENAVVVSVASPGSGMLVDWVDAGALARSRAVPTAVGVGRPVVGCGTPVAGTEVLVVGPDGRPVPERHVGEITLAGTSLFSGYRGVAAPHVDGSFPTGDLGYLADGELFVCGRKKDVIIVAGENVLPEQIETVAAGVLGRAARWIVAFGIDDDTLGTEVPIVVCESRHSRDEGWKERAERAVRRAVKEELGVVVGEVRFVPGGWVVRRDLKLARSASREKYLAERPPGWPGEKSRASSTELIAEVVALMEETLDVRPVAPDDDFFELGGNSLNATELALRLERRFGSPLPPEAFFRPTARTLAGFVAVGAIEPGPPEAESPSRPSGPGPSRARSPFAKRVRGRLRRELHRIVARREPERALADLRRWCGHRWTQRLLYAEEVGMLREFALELTGSEATPEMVRASLVNNAFPTPLEELRRRGRTVSEILTFMSASGSRFWSSLERALPVDPGSAPAGSEIVFSGLDALDRARAAGFGAVAVLSANAATHLAPFVMDRWWGRPVMVLNAFGLASVSARYRPGGSLHMIHGTPAVLVALYRTAWRVLSDGGLVLAWGDGEVGRSPMLGVAVGRRVLPLRTGFAELALHADVDVFPMDSWLEDDGRLTIHSGAAFDRDGEGAETRARVESVVRHFGDFLAERWRRAPENVSWRAMQRYLALAPAGGGAAPSPGERPGGVPPHRAEGEMRP